MATKHKNCKAKTRSGRKCSRLCKSEGLCTQHANLSLKQPKTVKSSPKKAQKIYIYYTLDNGGNPFKVEISDDNIVTVYIQDSEESDIQEKNVYQQVPFKTYKPEKIFIGKSILNKATKFSGARDDPKFDGNSILLEINSKKLEYIHIGAVIYSFKAYAKIKEYVSPVGNSSVPYPYAIDKNDNYYLVIEDVVLQHDDKIKNMIKEGYDPYDHYYDNNVIGNGNFENINSLKIDNENYMFQYSLEDFDQKKSRFKNAEFYLIKKDGSEEVLTKEKYNTIMNRFANQKRFKPFLNKVILHERLY
jgi:hypothetical protein